MKVEATNNEVLGNQLTRVYPDIEAALDHVEYVKHDREPIVRSENERRLEGF